MSTVFTPVVDADAAYGEGDWRPVLGENPRKDSWKLYMIGKPSLEHKLRGVILPSFDFTLALEDLALGTSVGACWTNQPQKGAERHFAANAWAVPIVMYPYLAPSKEHWLSPLNRRNMIGADALTPDDAMDAFDDLNRWVRRNKQLSQAKKDFFLKTEKLSEDPLVPGKTVRFAALNECWDRENDRHLAVTMFTASAYSYLVDQMRWRHQDKTDPRDPNWPTYMLGDPTDPAAALEWHADKVMLDSTRDAQETNVLCFTEKREFLDSDQKVHRINPETLAKRFMLVDPASWNIPTYEEQVDYMVHHFDPAVTADMIRAACAHRCRTEIPRDRPESVRLQSGGEDKERESERRSDPETQETPRGAGLAPRASAPPMPRDESPALPPRYWAGKAGGKPAQMTVGDLQAVVDSGRYEGFKVNMDGDKDWRSLTTCGLVTLPATPGDIPADVPATIPADVPATIPADVPATIPTDVAAPATEGTAGITLDVMRSKLFPDEETFQALTPAKKEEAEALVLRAWEATERGAKRDLPDDIVMGLMEILS